MAHYLLVAHQTAASQELIDRVREMTSEEADATFTLLVPATPVQHLLTWVEGEARALAQRDAETARMALEMTGARIARATVGDPSPLTAIDDELRERKGEYEGIVICTFPPGISRWLKLDLPHQAERRFGLPVIHVVSTRPEQPQGQKSSAL